MTNQTVSFSNTIFHENPAHNYPQSHWLCWDCVKGFVVLGSHGRETCPVCGGEMEHQFGLTTNPRGDIVVAYPLESAHGSPDDAADGSGQGCSPER